MASKIRFIRREHDVEIRAKRKSTGKWDTFGFCHPATVPLIQKEGIAPHAHLIKLPDGYAGTAWEIREAKLLEGNK